MRLASAVDLGRRFFNAWGERGPSAAVRAAIRYSAGQLRLWTAWSTRRALRRHVAGLASMPGQTPAVSVIMTTWNRAAMLPRAIDSVLSQNYANWELIIVDDGSDDDTTQVLAAYARDFRIRSVRQEHAGPGHARNRALMESRAEIIAYLDSDNEWCPDYLATLFATFHDNPDVQCAYCGIRRIDRAGNTSVHFVAFDSELLAEQNFIDLNVFSHRRELWENLGGFDPTLPRLNDWDLVRRYARFSAPLSIPVVGAQYHDGDWPRLSNTESEAYAKYLIRRKDDRPAVRRMKVLYALWHYPQLSESYVETEISCMRRWGMEIEVWSQAQPRAPHPVDIPVHRGSLKEAIALAAPDLVHIHWLNAYDQCRGALKSAGLPVTLRAHGFEFTESLVRTLNDDPVVRSIFLYPHQIAALPKLGKLRALTSAFDPYLYHPAPHDKDRRLVLRVAAGLPAKDLEILFRLAKRLPEFRFVLAAVTCNLKEAYVAELLHLNEEMGRPIDLRINMSHPAVAALVQQAGIYLHTFDPSGPPYGMPISIAETMACGAYIIARRMPPTAAYVGEAGDVYDTEAEAEALLRATLGWSDAQWQGAALRSVDRAYRHYVDHLALKPILDSWQETTLHASNRSVKRHVANATPVGEPALAMRLAGGGFDE